jgi:hypothetical protein
MNSTEEQLLIELIKGKEKKESYKNIDWNKFINLCQYHRITGFIQKKLDKNLVPKKEIKKLKEMNRKIALLNLILNNEMLLLFEELEKKKINAMAFKGMALNCTLYHKSFSRVSSDIDLLIKEKDFFEIKEIAEKKKYRTDSVLLWKKTPKIIKNASFSLFAQHFPVMEKKINGIKCMIELHKELFFPVNSFSVDLNEIWNDSKKEKTVLVPSNEDTIIIAVLSAVYQHNFYGMIEALIDVKNILAKKIDYKKLNEKTVKYNAMEPMIYFNELLKEAFGTEIKGINELETIADKKKLSFLRKNSLEKLVKPKSGFTAKTEKMKSRFYWAESLKQKFLVFFFVLILSGIWKIKKALFKS